jgi:predicted kinase
MSQLFVNIIGFNAAGKTTLAKKVEAEFGFSRVSGDDFREFVFSNITYFKDTPLSHRTEKYAQLVPLTLRYRIQMAEILLGAGQSVIFDGSGNLKEYRATYFGMVKKQFTEVKTIIIVAEAPEQELLARYQKRPNTEKWLDMYEARKKSFQPPTKDEADAILKYNQQNYSEIVRAIKALLT